MTREAARQVSVAAAAGSPVDPNVIDVNASSLSELEFGPAIAGIF